MPKEKKQSIATNPVVCQAVLMGPSCWRHVDEENRRAFGYSKIIVADNGELVTVP